MGLIRRPPPVRRANKKRRLLPPLALRASRLWVGGYDAIMPRTSRPARRAGWYAYSGCLSVVGRILTSIVEAIAPVDLAGLPEAVALLLRHDASLDAGRRAELQLDQPRAGLWVAQDAG